MKGNDNMKEDTLRIADVIIPELENRFNLLVFATPMITGRRLRKKWPGLTVRELIQGIDDANDKTNPTVMSNPYSMADFPMSYLLIGTIYDSEGKKLYICKSCESNMKEGIPYTRPYTMRKEDGIRKYKLGRVVFKKYDIEEYETIDNEWLKSSHDDEDDDSNDKFNYNIPASWWVGKDYQVIFNEHKDVLSKEIIAYIFAEKLHLSLTDIGKIFSSDEISRKIELDIKTYQRRAKKLLQKATATYNITFEG